MYQFFHHLGVLTIVLIVILGWMHPYKPRKESNHD